MFHDAQPSPRGDRRRQQLAETPEIAVSAPPRAWADRNRILAGGDSLWGVVRHLRMVWG